jgi:hypothetical protein
MSFAKKIWYDLAQRLFRGGLKKAGGEGRVYDDCFMLLKRAKKQYEKIWRFAFAYAGFGRDLLG